MQQPRRDIWTPIAGVLAAITFVVGMILNSDGPDDKDTDAQVIAWWADHGNRMEHVIGLFVLAFCGLFILWFASGLRQRLRAAEGPGGRLTNVGFGGAILLVGALWAGSSALGAIPAAQELGNEPALQSADVARFLAAAGYVAILIFASFGAIAFIDATSVVIRRTGILPGWFAWLGYVASVVLLFGAIFIPLIALPIWLVAGSVILFRLPSVEAEPVVVVPAPPSS